MLPLRGWAWPASAPWWRLAEHFLKPGRNLIYDRCLKVAVDSPKTARLLGKRPGVTRDAVYQQMRQPWCRNAAFNMCDGLSTAEYEAAHADLEEVGEKFQTTADESEWNWWIVCLLIAATGLVVLIAGGLKALAIAVVLTTFTVFVLFWCGSAVWFNLRHCLIAAVYAIAWAAARIRYGITAVGWGEVLLEEGTKPAVEQMVRHLLGDDPDSVFIPHSSRGLRAPRAPGYVVSNEAMWRLKRKLAQIEEGTLAVCGPRGAGKSTLLEECVKEADFGVIVQAPATYAPHDFLLSLSVRLCEEYVRHEGYEVPEFTRLSPFHRILRRTRARIRQLARWSAFAAPAAVLIVLGLSASVRSLYEQYAASASDHAQSYADEAQRWVRDIWQGHAIVASVIVVLIGIAWWKARYNPWLPQALGRIWAAGSAPLGLVVAAASVGSIAYDARLLEQVENLPPDTTGNIIVLTALWWLCRRTGEPGFVLPLGSGWEISPEDIFRPAATFVGGYLLYTLVKMPQTYAILADPENPPRLAGVVAGLMLARAGDWRPRRAEPALVTRCRNHLYRLQTVQMTTNTLSNSALNLGGSHATSVSTLPPNFPGLVQDFRDLLAQIAADKARQNQVVLIAIDEVDRLGSDTQALAFLSEIKAILGVRRVYYLISVAEDVGAAFVRRGLPHRDVTDSSLDDVIHVPPSTLKEARTILVKRSETLTAPYALLAHALSGGILRDLLRYGLQIEEMQAKTRSHELSDISRELILEELSETLAGFRTLLSKHEWTRSTSGILTAFRTLCGYLHAPCSCNEAALRHALEHFAFYAASDRPGPIADGELAAAARQLIDEAAAYAYFSLSLLDIFSAKRLDHRTRRATERGRAGEPERLADARLELGISPHSARTLIDDIRKAWSLPLGPTTNGHIPAPRRGACLLHQADPGS
ncbi:hypothetical protein ACWFRJ_44425 [Streptomyces sp. NPDC055239]